MKARERLLAVLANVEGLGTQEAEAMVDAVSSPAAASEAEAENTEVAGGWCVECVDSRGDYWAVWNDPQEVERVREGRPRWPRMYVFHGIETQCRAVAAALGGLSPRPAVGDATEKRCGAYMQVTEALGFECALPRDHDGPHADRLPPHRAGEPEAADRARTPTNSRHNDLTRQARALCDLIESLPAGEQQTACSIAASNLLRAIYVQTPPDPVCGANRLAEPCGYTLADAVRNIPFPTGINKHDAEIFDQALATASAFVRESLASRAGEATEALHAPTLEACERAIRAEVEKWANDTRDTRESCVQVVEDAIKALRSPAPAGAETAEDGIGVGPGDERWGEPMRWLTDDRDMPDRLDLVIMPGGNGDWYVSVVPEGQFAARGVRICTSGGAASAAPELPRAMAMAYWAMLRARATTPLGGQAQ